MLTNGIKVQITFIKIKIMISNGEIHKATTETEIITTTISPLVIGRVTNNLLVQIRDMDRIRIKDNSRVKDNGTIQQIMIGMIRDSNNLEI